MQRYYYVSQLGALDSLRSFSGHKYAFTYDSTSRLVSRTAPGGVQLDFTYDIDDRMTRRLERLNVAGTPDTVHLDSLLYTAGGQVARAKLAGAADLYQTVRSVYDRAGALAAIEFRRTTLPDTATTTEEFTFDAIGNITGTQKDRTRAVPVTTENTIADEGRLTAQTKAATDSIYVAADFSATQGQTVIKSALEYFCGDVCQENPPPTKTGKGYESMAWHSLDGKMRAFQRVGSDTTPETRFVFEEYRYDALGRRVLLRSRTRATCDSTFCKAAIERYVYDGQQLLFEIRVPGDSGKSDAALEADTSTVSAHYGRIGYVHGGGIDAPLALVRGSATIVPQANWRGFYDAATDTAGNNYATNINFISREQDPFLDAKLPRTVNGWSGSLLRAGQDQSGLMYRRNRYYDPGTGRFTQVDPIGLRGGVNLYGYALGDPVNLRDAFGLDPCQTSTGTVGGGLSEEASAACYGVISQLADLLQGVGGCEMQSSALRAADVYLWDGEMRNPRTNVLLDGQFDWPNDISAWTRGQNLGYTLAHEAGHMVGGIDVSPSQLDVPELNRCADIASILF